MVSPHQTLHPDADMIESSPWRKQDEPGSLYVEGRCDMATMGVDLRCQTASGSWDRNDRIGDDDSMMTACLRPSSSLVDGARIATDLALAVNDARREFWCWMWDGIALLYCCRHFDGRSVIRPSALRSSRREDVIESMLNKTWETDHCTSTMDWKCRTGGCQDFEQVFLCPALLPTILLIV